MKDLNQTIGNLVDKCNVAIISSVDKEGFPNTKAMLKFRERENLNHFYFTTNTSSMRVSQYLDNPKACIYFFDGRFFRGVMLKGTMEVLHSPDIKKNIWRPGDELYYPKGVTDPDYCVLKFNALAGRYYSNFKSEDFNIESE